jgi:hypothetical protein
MRFSGPQAQTDTQESVENARVCNGSPPETTVFTDDNKINVGRFFVLLSPQTRRRAAGDGCVVRYVEIGPVSEGCILLTGK